MTVLVQIFFYYKFNQMATLDVQDIEDTADGSLAAIGGESFSSSVDCLSRIATFQECLG